MKRSFIAEVLFMTPVRGRKKLNSFWYSVRKANTHK
jgi:hypothetical protein